MTSTSDIAGNRIILRRHPAGRLKVTDFAIEEYVVPAVGPGQFRVAIQYLSVDPMLRLFIDQSPLRGALPPLPAGSLVPGAAAGEVVESQHPGFPVGQHVEGRFGWQTQAISDGTGVVSIAASLGGFENALSVGGLPGFTAFVGLGVAGAIATGQTILVSGAAGAVGSMVGFLGKARGARLVGIAGGDTKRRYLLDDVGYDAVADRLAPDFNEQLKAALPNGADIYFDNVGGSLMAEVVDVLARGARILVCGLMAQYQDDSPSEVDHLPKVLDAIMFKSVRLQGFSTVGQDALRPAFVDEVSRLLASGVIRPEIHVEGGIERAPEALVNLFDRSTTGKVLVRVAN